MLVWDEEALLSRCGEKPKRVKFLINMFLGDYPDAVAQMQASLKANEAQALHAQAHTMKGIAANIGALKLQEAMFNLEQFASQEETLPLCTKAMTQVTEEIHHLTHELASYMEQ